MVTDLSRLRALTQRSLTLEPVRDAQLTFRSVLNAMARPGSIVQLPVAAPGAPVNPWLAAVLVTLVDHEVSLAVEAFEGAADIERYVRQRTAVAEAAPEHADFVVAAWNTLDARLPERLRQGTLEYPNDSATLLLLAPALRQDVEIGLRLSLAGPGVPAGFQVQVAGLAPAFFEARDEAAEYPCGIDLLLIDPAGQALALPRSTAIQIADDSAGR